MSMSKGNEERRQYAVAMTMVKDNRNGSISIVTRLNWWSAHSIEEAVGIATIEAQEANKDYQIHTVARIELPAIAQEARDE